ncbi:MAG: hypothetical protein ABW252_21245 [Polyangiales bacterium]
MRMVNSVFGGASLCVLALLIIEGTPPHAAAREPVPSSARARAEEARATPSDKTHCDALLGAFTSVVGAPCASPVGLCTHGTLEGDLAGQYDFTFETLVPANDPLDRFKYFYTGTSVVSAKQGRLITHDTGVIHMLPDNEPSPFVTTATVVDASGKYASRRGEFVATGFLTFGNATGSYAAELCKDKTK